MPDEEENKTPEPEPTPEPTPEPEPTAEPEPAAEPADPSALLAQIKSDFEAQRKELTAKYEEALAQRDKMIREILTGNGGTEDTEPEDSEIQRRFVETHGEYKKW